MESVGRSVEADTEYRGAWLRIQCRFAPECSGAWFWDCDRNRRIPPQPFADSEGKLDSSGSTVEGTWSPEIDGSSSFRM